MTIRPLLLTILGLFFVVLASAASAEPALNVSGNILVDTSYDSNATKLENQDEENYLAEQQNIYGVGAQLAYFASGITFDADYNARQNVYTQNTQADDTTYYGESTLVLGSYTDIFGLAASHDIRRVLDDPEDDVIVANTSQQTTLSIVPSITTRRDRQNYLELSGLYVETRNSSEFREDTKQQGSQLEFVHRINPLRSLGVVGQVKDVLFDESEDLDYLYNRASIYLESSLRQLEYLIELGGSIIEPEVGEKQDGMFQRFNLAYSTGATNVGYEYLQDLSDSSTLAAGGDLGDGINVGGGEEQDQLQLSRHNLNARFDALCDSCTVMANMSKQKLDYLNIDDLDNDTLAANITFNFNYSPLFKLGVKLNTKKTTYDITPDRDSTNRSLEFNGAYLLTEHINIEPYIGLQRRQNITNPYQTGIFGVRLLLSLD